MKRILGLFLIAAAFSVALARGADQPKPADVSGTWNIEVQTSQGVGHPVFTFKQEGDKLTGHYKGRLGEADVTGSVKGDEVTFSVTVTGDNGTLKIEYSGTVEGDAMKGKAKFGDFGEGPFTGKKQAK